MAEIFPATLQDKVNEAGFTHGIGPTAITTEMDIGPAKKRRRFTKGIDTFAVTFDINLSLYTTLYNFFNTTLNGGVKTFLYDHPLTGDEREFRFIGEPTMAPLGGSYVRVSMAWELMP